MMCLCLCLHLTSLKRCKDKVETLSTNPQADCLYSPSLIKKHHRFPCRILPRYSDWTEAQISFVFLL